jgi:hypothetical protein
MGKGAMTTTVLIEHDFEIESETDRIVRWRLETLHRAGYAEHDARLLADRRDVDLHTAVDLLARGCPEETALLILL